MSVLRSVLRSLRVLLQTRAALQLEILALRHQLAVLERARPERLRLTRADRVLWRTVQQLRNAFPWDQVPRYLIRDRDHAFEARAHAAKSMGIDEVLGD